jgi:hypothetical protein
MTLAAAPEILAEEKEEVVMAEEVVMIDVEKVETAIVVAILKGEVEAVMSFQDFSLTWGKKAESVNEQSSIWLTRTCQGKVLKSEALKC